MKILYFILCFLFFLSCSQAIKDLASEAKSVLAEVQNSGSSKSVGALNSEIKKLEKKLEEKEEELEEIKDDIEDKEDDLEDVEEELAEIEERLEDAEELTPSQRSDLVRQRDALLANKASLTARIRELEGDRDTARTERDTAQDARAAAEAERNTIRTASDGLFNAFCNPTYTEWQTGTKIDFECDPGDDTLSNPCRDREGSDYDNIGSKTSKTEGNMALLKYLKCHSNPETITWIETQGSWVSDIESSYDRNRQPQIIYYNPTEFFTVAVLTLLGVNELSWSCDSTDNKWQATRTDGTVLSIFVYECQ